MLARVLKLALLAIVLTALLAARGTGRADGLPEDWILLALAALGAALGIAVLGVATTLLTFTIKWIREPRPETGAAEPMGDRPSRVGMLAAEWLAFIRLFALIQPFERWWMGDDDETRTRGDAKPLVLLVHGYMCNRGLWWGLRKSLRAAGYPVATINLEPPLGGIDTFAERLHTRIRGLQPSGEQPICIVAHSMGGLVARRYLQRHGTAGIVRLVTLGSPHHGTDIAWLGIGRCAQEMRRGSDLLDMLPDAAPASLPVVSIWSTDDNFMIPGDTARLAGARDVRIQRLGHLAMAFSPVIRRIVLDEMAAAAPEAPSRSRHARDESRA